MGILVFPSNLYVKLKKVFPTNFAVYDEEVYNGIFIREGNYFTPFFIKYPDVLKTKEASKLINLYANYKQYTDVVFFTIQNPLTDIFQALIISKLLTHNDTQLYLLQNVCNIFTPTFIREFDNVMRNFGFKKRELTTGYLQKIMEFEKKYQNGVFIENGIAVYPRPYLFGITSTENSENLLIYDSLLLQSNALTLPTIKHIEQVDIGDETVLWLQNMIVVSHRLGDSNRLVVIKQQGKNLIPVYMTKLSQYTSTTTASNTTLKTNSNLSFLLYGKSDDYIEIVDKIYKMNIISDDGDTIVIPNIKVIEETKKPYSYIDVRLVYPNNYYRKVRFVYNSD